MPSGTYNDNLRVIEPLSKPRCIIKINERVVTRRTNFFYSKTP